MDEYTFLVLAKLKTDRLKLEREAREALRVPSDEAETRRVESRPPVRKTRWFGRETDWRLQS